MGWKEKEREEKGREGEEGNEKRERKGWGGGRGRWENMKGREEEEK